MQSCLGTLKLCKEATISEKIMQKVSKYQQIMKTNCLKVNDRKLGKLFEKNIIKIMENYVQYALKPWST